MFSPSFTNRLSLRDQDITGIEGVKMENPKSGTHRPDTDSEKRERTQAEEQTQGIGNREGADAPSGSDRKGGGADPPSGSDLKGGGANPPSGSDLKGGGANPPSGSDLKGGGTNPPSGSELK